MKKSIKILFILLFLLTLCGCKKKEDEKEKIEPVVKVRDLSEEEINKLAKNVDDLIYFDINPAKSFKTSDLTNQEVLLWAVGFGDASGVEFKEYENKAKDYLDYSLEPEPILCMTHYNILGSSDYKYVYDVESKKFVLKSDHSNHSDIGYYAYVYNKYISSSYNDGDYIITFGKLFSETNAVINASFDAGRKRNWFVSYGDAKSGNNPVVKNMDNNQIKEYLNKMDSNLLVKYTYTFKQKDDKFVLKSYEIG